MKRIISILLLAVFLFNVGGYYIVFWQLGIRAGNVLIARIEANRYSSEETVEFKIPVTLPYPVEQRDYEPVKGKFEHNGKFYQLVKQRIANDTLYIVCIRDMQQKRLTRNMTEYSRMTNELPASSKTSFSFIKDFDSLPFANLVTHNGWFQLITFAAPFAALQTQFSGILAPPPEV